MREQMDDLKARKLYPSMRLDTKHAIDRYVTQGLAPGGFITAVMENNLFGAIERADLGNLNGLPDIVKYIYSNCPMGCHGHKGVVEKWIQRLKENGTLRTGTESPSSNGQQGHAT